MLYYAQRMVTVSDAAHIPTGSGVYDTDEIEDDLKDDEQDEIIIGTGCDIDENTKNNDVR